MIRQRIRLVDYDWTVFVYYEARMENLDEILDMLEEFGADSVTLSKCEENFGTGEKDRGATYSNPEARVSVMVVGESSSPSEFQSTFDHEKGHVAKHISLAVDIDPYGEEMEYLEGNIGRLLFPIARLFLCEHCRNGLEGRV